MRVTFHLLILVANILTRHAQLFEVGVQLEDDVKTHHRDNAEHHQQRAEADQIQGVAHGGKRRFADQAHHFRPVVPEVKPRGAAHQHRFENGFEQLGPGLGREHFRNARQRVEFGKFRLQRFAAKNQTAEHHRRDQRDQHDPGYQGQQRDHGPFNQLDNLAEN